ncbi:hypothetical protein F5148DRAFT_1275584 [Russula earlei]|uniref:Uncharacterized protein n=1 Tax=Russula earlei TaxID=71964 RepID=A0ACC0UB67_9AGAM|nr:hypothetical protein F5148DRAFT_1275584 [Russula earlei]
MASMASTSSTTLIQKSRPQAGPLPLKRGEIGYVEGSELQTATGVVAQDTLPAHHPADRLHPTPSQDSADGLPSRPDNSEIPADGASSSIIGKRLFLRPRKLPKVMGIHFKTIALLCAQLLFFAGTLVGWVFTALAISGGKFKPPPPPSGEDPNLTSMDSGSSNIFVHVAFAVVVLAQIVFLERRFFRARAERYMYKHPGEMLPISLQRGHVPSASMSISPWSRPSLPSYAAALAASGVGTGDVEDAVIAQPPPPSYGKTRGSTLVLAGYLRNSLRVQAREHEQDRRLSSTTERSDRPISFVSRDEEWEERRDADRARRIEEALAALEDARPVMRRTTEGDSRQE